MKCFSTLTESGWKLMPVSVTALYTLDSLQLLSQIESAPSEGQAKKILIDAIINKIADLMGTDKGGIDPKALLFSFGLNSMQVVQLKTWMDNALPVTLSITQMNQYATIASLVELLLEAMSSKTAGDLEAVGLSTPSGNDIETQNGQLLLEGAGQRSLLKVNEVADPDLVAFIFPSIAPAGNVASTVREQASKLAIPNEDQIQMCIVQMPYSSQPGHPIDWAKNVRNAAVAIKDYMDRVWREHRDDSSTLPIVFVGHVFGALVAVEVAHAMQVSCEVSPANLIVIHMRSPDALMEQHRSGANVESLVRFFHCIRATKAHEKLLCCRACCWTVTIDIWPTKNRIILVQSLKDTLSRGLLSVTVW